MCITSSPRWLNTSYRAFTEPISGRLRDGRASVTVIFIDSVSPAYTGFTHRSSSTPGEPIEAASSRNESHSMRWHSAAVCQPLAQSPLKCDAFAASGSTWKYCGSNCVAKEMMASAVTVGPCASRTEPTGKSSKYQRGMRLSCAAPPSNATGMVRPMPSVRVIACAALAAALLFAACPKAVPDVKAEVKPADAGVSEAELLRPRVAAIEKETAEVLRAVDEALWKHWTTGAPLELAKAAAGHDALFSKDTLLTIRRAREVDAKDARALAHLERWLVGELLARAIAAESEAVANLEASVTFQVDGKELAWRDLNRLLTNEKSAVKRRALWTASHTAAERISAAIARRDEKAKEYLASLDVPSTLELAAETRELELESLARLAEHFLDRTSLSWRATLQRLSDADARLPVDTLTRADLPRLLRANPGADAAFPKKDSGARAVQLLGGLGLYGRPGLTLELAEAAKKNPLPLTIAPSPGDVRVSFRPAGGARDMTSLLAEVGTAISLHAAHTGRVSTERLGDPANAQVLAELFAGLPADTEWLASAGVPEASRATVVDAVRAQRLFVLRRAAGVVLARLETATLADTDAPPRFVAVMTRALGVKLAPEERARWRVETDDFLRSATLLKSAVLAEVLRERLGPSWWSKPESGKALLEQWAPGSGLSVEGRLGAAVSSVSSLVVALGGSVAAAPDAGVGAWPAPQQLAERSDEGTDDAGAMVGAWPRPQALADAGR